MHILVQITALDPVTGLAATVRATTAQDRSVTNLNSQIWRPAIKSGVGTLSMSLFDGDFTQDPEPGGFSFTLILDQLERVSPNVRRYAWAGASVTVYAGEIGQAWPWTTALTGKVSGFQGQGNDLQISVTVDQEPFNRSVLTATYAGTTGLEGDSDLANRPKPMLLGRCKNVEPVLIDATNSIFQFHAYGPINAVNALYERGSAFPASSGDYANYAALAAASVPNGKYATCLAQGLIKLGAPPYGVITGDIEGDKPSTWLSKTGEIINRVATNAGVQTGNIDSSSLTALDSAISTLTSGGGVIGVYVTAQETVLDFARRLARPCNAMCGISWTGKLFVTRVQIGSSQMTLDAQSRQQPGVYQSLLAPVSPPYARIEMTGSRSWRVYSLDEIAFADFYVDRGNYSGATTYRYGDIVFQLSDGNRYLYINATPTSGNAPPNATYWTIHQDRDADIVTIIEGTELYLTPGAPTNQPYPLSTTATANSDGSVNYTLTWDHYWQGALPADFLVIYWCKADRAPVATDPSIVVPVNAAWRTSYIFEGVSPADTMSFGIAAGRNTSDGAQVGTIRSLTGGTTRTNLLLRSEEFDNASWTKSAITITANATTAPDGTSTADKLVETATTAAHYVLQDVSLTSGQTAYQMVYAKAGERDVLQITSSTGLTGNGTAYQNFDLANGVLGSGTGMAGAAMYALGGGWYLCMVSDTVATTGSGRFGLALATSASSGRLPSYLGSTSNGLYLWGADLKTSSFNPYIQSVASQGAVTNPDMQGLGATTPNFTGNLSGTAASTVATATANFNGNNDRNATTPTAPTVAGDGTCIDHVINTDSSCDISFEWSYTVSTVATDANNIDGFIVYVASRSSSGAYTFGSSPVDEISYTVPADRRAFILPGVPANRYYTFGVQAYRIVDNDVAAAGIKSSAIVKSSASGENPYQPSASIAFTGDVTGTINSTSAATVAGAAVNFNLNNDRNSTTPTAPVVPTDGTGVDHVINTDGSADISLEWTYTTSSDPTAANNIDGFLVYVRSSSSSSSYTFGTTLAEETIYQFPADRRAFILQGVPANSYYTLGVQAYRAVDTDIDASGYKKSTLVKATGSGENPYRPSASVAFAGDVTGTIDGDAAGTVVGWATSGQSAYDGTVKYRTGGAPTNAPYPIAVTTTSNQDGSRSYKIEWDHYVQGANQADMLLLFWRKDSTAPTVNDGSIAFNVNTTWRSFYIFEGVNPADTFSFGLAAARRTENGLEVGTIQAFTGAESRTNICLQSATLGSATWTKTNTTISADTVTAPDGAVTADKVLETTTNATHTIVQTITVSASTAYVVSYYVKANSRTLGYLWAQVGAASITQTFDLAAGTQSLGTPSGGIVAGSSGIVNVGDGWFRVWFGLTTQAGGTSLTLNFGIKNDSNQTSYAGDTAKGLTAWGFQVETGTAPTPRINTLSTSNSVTGPDMLGLGGATANYTGNVNSLPATDISTTINTGGGVAANQVSTAAVQADAISERTYVNVGSAFYLSTSMQLALDITLSADVAGEPQKFTGVIDANDTSFEGSSTAINVTIQRCNASTGTVVATLVSDRQIGTFSDENISSGLSAIFAFIDTPTSTDRRYKVSVKQVDSSASQVQTSSFIQCEALKR